MPLVRIIDSTLREGEQSALSRFRTDDKVAIARALDELGVDYIELSSPAASPHSRRDAERIVGLDLAARASAHVRCVAADVRAAIEVGVSSIRLYFGTSPVLRRASHGRTVQQILDAMVAPIDLALSAGLETHFSAEDAFRTEEEELLRIIGAADAMGVHRVGLADTVGTATPHEVYRLVSMVQQAVSCGVGFHGHNDTGCAVANAYEAVRAGASHVDVSVLGIGERVGITPLGAFIARLIASPYASTVARYRLDRLASIERLVAERLGIQVPFNNCVTGGTAFVHKSGTHIKAMLNDPESYEAMAPEPFGLHRTLIYASPLTGRHAVANRAEQLGLTLDEDQIAELTARVKELSREHELTDVAFEQVLRERGGSGNG